MNPKHGVVIQRADDWLIVLGDQSRSLEANAQADDLADLVSEMTERAAIKNPQWVVAPHATSCFFVVLSPEGSMDVRDRAALTYELEDHLPIDAESMVADFKVVPGENDGQTIAAVAVEMGRWKPVVEALESSGATVASIVPAAILAAEGLAADPSQALLSGTAAELLLVEDSKCNALAFVKQTVCRWKHLSLDPPSLQRHRQLDAFAAEETVVVGADETQHSVIQQLYAKARRIDLSFDELVIRGAGSRLAQRAPAGFNLRRDALAPEDRLRLIDKQLRLAGCCAAIFLVTLSVAGWWRAHRIESQIDLVRQRQQELFREVFPNAQPPAALVRRVRSEHVKILGSRGETSEVDIPTPATDVLRQLIVALPADLRIRFKSIDVVNGKVDLDVQVRSPVDAGTVAKSLAAAGFRVKPPGTTQKDNRTFESLIEAEWLGESPGVNAPVVQVSVHVSHDRGVAG